MNRKLVHPLWVHLPAIAAFLVFLGYLIAAVPLPAEAPVHFSAGGTPDRYGSPWEVFGLLIALSVLFLVVSGLIDELWARQEKKKSFNWLAWLDDLTVGAMAGFGLGYLAFLNSGETVYSFSGPWFWPVLAGTTILGLLAETLRPYRPCHEPLPPAETAGLEQELSRRIRNGQHFVYWDYQMPLYVNLLSILLPLVMFVSAYFSWMEAAWMSVLLVVVGLLMVVLYGGQRTLVTRDTVTVRWGIFGIPVLRLKTSDIASAELHRFSPLRDFGGYGIRFNREMKAYYLRGGAGVLLTLHNGKKYLIGSDKPADLLTVVQAVIGTV